MSSAVAQGSAQTVDRTVTWGMIGLLTLATFGEGGGSVAGLAAWHLWWVGLLLWLVLRRRPVGPHVVESAPAIAFGLFALLVGVNGAIAPSALAAWFTLLELAAFGGLAWLAAKSGPALLAGLIWPLRVAGALHGGWAVIQRFVVDLPRPAGTFLDSNHLGGWLGAILLLGLADALCIDERGPRLAAFALALPAAAGLLVSGSRGALMAVVVAAAWLIVCAWSLIGPRQRVAVLLVGLLGLAGVGVKLAERARESDPFNYHRLKIWRASLGPFIENPWWGAGPGQFEVAATRSQFPDGHGPLSFDRRFTVTHSDLLRLPSELGLPATLVFAVVMGSVIRQLTRRRKATPTDGILLGAQAALLAIVLQALVANPSRWPALYLLAAVLIGSQLSGRPIEGARPSLPVRGALATIVLLLFVVGDVGPTVAYFQFQPLPAAGALGPRGLDRLDRATRLNPLDPRFHARRAEHLLRGPTFDLAAYAEAREAAEAAVRLQPADGTFRWILGRVEGQAFVRLFHDEATRERAYDQLARAQELLPYDPRISIEAGELALLSADPGRARRLAAAALRLEPHGVPAHLLMAEALLAMNTAEGPRAAEMLEQAERLAVEHAASASKNRYSREMLTLDTRRAELLRRRLSTVAADGS